MAVGPSGRGKPLVSAHDEDKDDIQTTDYRGMVLIHVHLWDVVKRQLARAEANPVGSGYDRLVALTFAGMFSEGYVNFLGGYLDPAAWGNERKVFPGGIRQKTNRLAELLGLPAPDKTVRPYKSVDDLRLFRDSIAHAKPIVRKGIHTGTMADYLNMMMFDFDGITSPGRTAELLQDVQQFFVCFYTAFSDRRRKGEFPEAIYANPFSGPSAYNTTTTT